VSALRLDGTLQVLQEAVNETQPLVGHHLFGVARLFSKEG
jgi:hypothetical protein